jgi:hypothetical protein
VQVARRGKTMSGVQVSETVSWLKLSQMDKQQWTWPGALKIDGNCLESSGTSKCQVSIVLLWSVLGLLKEVSSL